MQEVNVGTSLVEAKAGVKVSKMNAVATPTQVSIYESVRSSAVIKRGIKAMQSHMKTTGADWASSPIS
eukprot:50373-Pyramimonas_sp.AAC.1